MRSTRPDNRQVFSGTADRLDDFEKSNPELTGSLAPENLKFEREDWALFRTVEGLQQKAGVAKHDLARLVLKEIVDNALDEGAKVRIDECGDGYFVEDDGRGIDGTPHEIARLFSIGRPLVSTKLLRLPSRGALGNGLRVVAGAVLASQGKLAVITRNRRIELRPERDGTTTVVAATPVDFPVGTRIEIAFGPALPCDSSEFSWADMAIFLATGERYAGRSSPWWYDLPQFHELISASGLTPVRELIASLDGCTGAKAGEIVAAAKLGRMACRDVSSEQAAALLKAARESARPVKPERLGAAGPHAFPGRAYARALAIIRFGSAAPFAEVPAVVEAWEIADDDTDLLACVNRTPVTGNISAARDNRDIDAFGCGLHHTLAKAPIDKHFKVVVNIITPFMPITSDGKEPNFLPFFDAIATAVEKAVRKAHRPTSTAERLTQKDVVLDNLDDVIAKVSGDGEFRFIARQLLYKLRPIVRDEIDETLTTAHFNTIITDYENEHGEIPGMYRDPRGSIYHPHSDEVITLGTLMVEDYERPAWTFNKVVYIEKEGFSEALKAARWPERHNCMLMSSKGFSTRAARDLVDKLAEHDEPVTIFCVHDADAYGTMIYQTLQEATKALGARKIEIANLGLEPWEALAMGLEAESVEKGERRKPVADYILERDDDDYWEEWLQKHRVELNAMTTPQFIEWLDQKMAGYDKLIPPAAVLRDELNERIAYKVRADLIEQILKEAKLDECVAAALAKIKAPDVTDLFDGIQQLFEEQPDAEWRDHIEAVANKFARRAKP
jgi:hypothetical protein